MNSGQVLWQLLFSVYVNQVSVKSFIFTLRLQQTNLLCVLQPFCSLHLHLHVSENPYTSGNIVSKDSAPGIIIASGEDIVWFAHPCCCLLSALMLLLDHIPQFYQSDLFFSSVPSTIFLSWQQFTDWNETHPLSASVPCSVERVCTGTNIE